MIYHPGKVCKTEMDKDDDNFYIDSTTKKSDYKDLDKKNIKKSS